MAKRPVEQSEEAEEVELVEIDLTDVPRFFPNARAALRALLSATEGIDWEIVLAEDVDEGVYYINEEFERFTEGECILMMTREEVDNLVAAYAKAVGASAVVRLDLLDDCAYAVIWRTEDC